MSPEAGTVARPAARVLCLDPEGRVLLLRWRDPVDPAVFWEPPGGGVEPGETSQEAARRELHEETGLPGDVVTDAYATVHRDFRYAGVHYRGPETFYLGRVEVAHVPGAAALTEREDGTLLDQRWFGPDDLGTLAEAVEPADLAHVLAELAGGPWRR